MNSLFLRHSNRASLGKAFMGLHMNARNAPLSMYKVPTMNNYYSRAMFCTERFGHQVRNEFIFQSFNSRYSNKSQRGLYHRKTHRPAFKVCFSDKRHRYTQKPNVKRKNFYSEILGFDVRLPVTTYALKNIIKAGSFDNYILNTKKEKINSKMGLFLRKLMFNKLENPDMKVPYVPFQARNTKKVRKRPKYLRNMPTVYIPAAMKQTEDFTEWHEKLPNEMTREEIAEFEAVMKDPEYYSHRDKEWKRQQPQFKMLREEIRKLQPMRHEVIKKYWRLNIDNPDFRKKILDDAEATEDLPKWVLEDEYVHFKDAIPEIKDFLEDIERKKKLDAITKKVKTLGEIHLRIGDEFSDFNAYENENKFKGQSVKFVKKKWKPEPKKVAS